MEEKKNEEINEKNRKLTNYKIIIWLFILHKKMAFTYIAEEIGRDLEGATYSDLDEGGFFTKSKKIFKNNDEKWLNEFFKKRKIFTKGGSAFLVSFILPTGMIVIWIGILIVTWRCI
jgi:hypothetical protein